MRPTSVLSTLSAPPPLLQPLRTLTAQPRPLFRNQTHRAASGYTSGYTVKRPSPHNTFYKTHGRALFKSLTLAFFSYQTFYWYWLLIESESVKDEKDGVINELKAEARLLGSGIGSHTHAINGKRVLEEDEKNG